MLTGIAVEVREPKGLGRCRMLPLADASAASLHPFVTDHVEPGATVFTDGWQGYHGLEKLGYGPCSTQPAAAARARGEDTDLELLPAVHRVASWPSGGCWAPTKDRWTPPTWPATGHEFVPASTADGSRSRGMVFYRVLELALPRAATLPSDLIATKRPAGGVAHAARQSARAPAEPGSPSSEPPAWRSTAGLRISPVKWIPQMEVMRRYYAI